MNWMDKYPLTKRLEQVWEGCGWIEGLESLPHEPLIEVPTLENLDEWRREILERRKRVWAKAERYFEQDPQVYEETLALGQEYKRRGWLGYT